MNAIELLIENLKTRAEILKLKQKEIYLTHTTIEVVQHRSYELASMDAQVSHLNQVLSVLKGGEEGIKQNTESLTTLLDELKRTVDEIKGSG